MNLPLSLRRALEQLAQRLALSVLRGKVLRTNDATKLPQLQIEGLRGEVLSQVEHVQHFGFRSRVPAGGECLALCPGGDRASAVAVGTADRRVTVVALAEGEVVVYDARGRSVHFGAAGLVVDGASDPVTLRSSVKVTIDAPLLECQDLHASGDVQADGDVTDLSGTAQSLQDIRDTFNAHTHSAPGVTSGPSTLPVPAPNSPPM